jgi:hypothetical protein
VENHDDFNENFSLIWNLPLGRFQASQQSPAAA